jgi:beta-hydroxylase
MELKNFASSSFKQEEQRPPWNLSTSKLLSTFFNWVESLNGKFSAVGDRPVYDNTIFPGVVDVEREWMKIRAELDQVMQRREELPSFHDITSEVKTITDDQHWKTFFLVVYGVKSDENCRRCPETTRILKKIPGMKTAFFSILSPHKHIPPHRGAYNGVLRYHLGLIVPEPREKCRIRIGNEIRHWDEGESLIFDDTYEHEVWNETSGYRVVLFVDFVRPIKFPFDLLNLFLLFIAKFTPLMREGKDNQKKWEKKFYKR